MAKITYIQANGAVRVVDVKAGFTLMEGAMRNDVEGMLAECGGARSCATCHVYLAPEWMDRVKPASPDETDLLELVDDLRPTSRLSCQIPVDDTLNGMVVEMPAEQ